MAKLTPEQKKTRAETKKIKKEQEAKAMESERLKSLLDRHLSQLRLSPIPLAKITYQVGDLVKPRVANWNSMKVLEILDDGKILKIEISSTENNYGNPFVTTREDYVSHLEVLPNDYKEESSFKKEENIQVSFHNSELSSLLHSHYQSGIDYNAPYQRGLVWSEKDKESLIDSIFNNIEIGKFVFVDLAFNHDLPNGGKNYEILDGKQRLTTLVEFFEDKFQYKGKFFSDLSRRDKNHFRSYNVTLGRAREELTLEDKMKYFLKMNVAGVPQSEEHLQKVRRKLSNMEKKDE